jgi:hypothetical protein
MVAMGPNDVTAPVATEDHSVMRIDTQGTTPYRLGRPKEGSAMTQPTICKILEVRGMLPKA